ncbi:MAG: hypothetical protein ABJF04_09485 [Reichenbachiella sp.]|uniref:hypothetical protein n=1 Tax=Reichenbachiella sp. TaxID=2184521 RepID=UPI003264E77E
MKRYIATLFLTIISTVSYAQWQDPSGNETGAIHYNGGNVGIGTSNAGSYNSNASYQIYNSNDRVLDVQGGSNMGWISAGSNISNGILGGIAFTKPNGQSDAHRQIAYIRVKTTQSYYNTPTSTLEFGTKGGGALGIPNLVISPGLMGVGTSTPSANLHIESYSKKDVKLQLGTEVSSGGPLTIAGRIDGSTDISTAFQGGFIAYQLSGSDNVRSLNLGANEWSDSWNGGSRISFWTSPVATGNSWGPSIERLRIDRDGNIGIGTTTPTNKLEVNGTIRAQEIKVEASPWPDYVFTDEYQLSTLEETASYIKENHHLSEIPSAEEIEANGVNLGEMNMLLLKKIEELTLHIIEMNNRMKLLEIENSENRRKEI